MSNRRVDTIEKSVVTDTCAVWNVLSSGILHNACTQTGFVFALTDFVLYECLHKPRTRQKHGDAALRERLKAARMRDQFKNYSLSIEDLQDISVLEQRQRLAKGELSAIAFARRVNLAFQTDDQSARKLAANALGPGRVQTTPHVLGWLFFWSHLTDSDFGPIVQEHESLEGTLRPYLEAMYNEAMRCRLQANTRES